MNVAQAMTELAELLAPHVSRLVTADPTKSGSSPCVLIDLPELDPTTSTLCGDMLATFPVLVIGQPGALPEIRGLSALLQETMNALVTTGIGFTRVVPVSYTPMAETGTADPAVAYQITVERYVR